MSGEHVGGEQDGRRGRPGRLSERGILLLIAGVALAGIAAMAILVLVLLLTLGS